MPLRKRTELMVMGFLIFSIVGYALMSILYTGARVAEADRTLNSVVSHQNSLNMTFGDIDSQVSTLETSGTFDSGQALMLVDLSIENANLATRTIAADDRSLSVAAHDVRSASWLSTMGRAGLDREAARLAHARAALAAASVIADGQALDGQFWHALYSGLADFAVYSATSSPAPLRSASTEIDYASRMAAYAPGLPDELRAMMTDLQVFIADTAAGASVAGDLNRIAAYNLETIGAEINAYYRPLVARYNAEITAATAP